MKMNFGSMRVALDLFLYGLQDRDYTSFCFLRFSLGEKEEAGWLPQYVFQLSCGTRSSGLNFDSTENYCFAFLTTLLLFWSQNFPSR